MTLTQKHVDWFFLLLCSAMAIYLVVLQLKNYLANEDLISMSYRRFNSEEKDEYPTLTICFDGYRGAIFDGSDDIFDQGNASAGTYQRYINGRPNYNKSSFDYNSINYDEVALDINKGYLIRSEKGFSLACLFSKPARETCRTEKLLMGTYSYGSGYAVCFTKKISYRKNQIQQYDFISLNASLLYEKDLNVRAIIHQKRQLFRSAKKATVPITPADYENGFSSQYEINEIEVLRRREKSEIPCNASLTDEDSYIMRKLAIDMGCIPTYWEKFKDKLNFPGSLSRCNNRRQYSKFRKASLKITNSFSSMKESYIEPCSQMKIAVATKSLKKEKVYEGEIRLYFLYLDDSYKEVVNLKAYTAETLLGQVGGYVGKKRLVNGQIEIGYN